MFSDHPMFAIHNPDKERVVWLRHICKAENIVTKNWKEFKWTWDGNSNLNFSWMVGQCSAVFWLNFYLLFFSLARQTYLVGQAMSLAGPDIMEPTTKFNNYRIYGTFLLVSQFKDKSETNYLKKVFFYRSPIIIEC